MCTMVKLISLFFQILATLLLAAAVSRAAGPVSFSIRSASGALLDTVRGAELGELGDGAKPTMIELRGTNSVDVSLDVDGSAQGRLIIADGTEKNVAISASASGGSFKASFSWDAWKNQFGEIEEGKTFSMSMAIWSSDPPLARRADVAVLTYVKGPAAAVPPGKVPLAARVTEALASMAIKPEIVHMFRPEEKMVPAALSYAFALVVFAPMVLAAGLMTKIASVPRAASDAPSTLSYIFYGGIVSIVAIEIAFWLGLFNLMQVFPVLLVTEVVVMVVGIKASHAAKNRGGTKKETTAKKNK